MATVDDIDTTAAVRKYLDRQVVVSTTQEGQDQGEEITAVLEAVAIAFLLSPQSALTMVLMAKNQLQQIVTKDRDLIDFLSKAVSDVSNPDTAVADTSDITEAQTALVEVDKLGSFTSDTKAYARYNTSINRFLNQQLATSLKRRGQGEFERSGTEARQDLTNGLSMFGSTHSVMADLLKEVAAGVDNFRSVDLTKIVSSTTVSRVRSSLTQIQQGLQNGTLSKTVAAIELIAGSASLQSISNARDIYDPTVDTGNFPVGRTIVVSSEESQASLKNAGGPYTVGASAADVQVAIDESGSLFSGTAGIPVAGSPANRAWVVSSPLSLPVTLLPAGSKKLYITLVGAVSPDAVVDLTSYATLSESNKAAIISAINGVLGADATASIVPRADGKQEIVIVGSTAITSIVVRDSGDGSVNPSTGVYTAAAPSAHASLGFSSNQVGSSGTTISAQQLANRLNAVLGTRATASVQDQAVVITSSEAGPTSGVHVISSYAGFQFPSTPAYSTPEALLLLENGDAVDPSSVGVFVGSLVTTTDFIDSSRSGSFTVTAIDGSRLLFDSSILLPRGNNRNVTILAPSVSSVQDLVRRISPFIGTFDSDSSDLQRVSAPLLSQNPTPAQIGDATRFLTSLRSRVSSLLDILSSIVVRDDQSAFAATAKNILQGLEERGLDQATDLLKASDFSGFFALTPEAASKSSAFLNSIETVMKANFTTSTTESDQDDLQPNGEIPDGTLATLEPSSDSA